MAESTTSSFLSLANPISSLVSGVSSAFGSVYSAITGASLAKKQQQIDLALSNLSAAERNALEQQIALANTETDRIAILENAVTQIQLKRLDNQSATKNSTTVLLFTGAAIVLGGALVLSYTLRKN